MRAEMHTGLYVKCLLLLSYYTHGWNCPTTLSEKRYNFHISRFFYLKNDYRVRLSLQSGCPILTHLGAIAPMHVEVSSVLHVNLGTCLITRTNNNHTTSRMWGCIIDGCNLNVEPSNIYEFSSWDPCKYQQTINKLKIICYIQTWIFLWISKTWIL
jgi:hypothetical protein